MKAVVAILLLAVVAVCAEVSCVALYIARSRARSLVPWPIHSLSARRTSTVSSASSLCLCRLYAAFRVICLVLPHCPARALTCTWSLPLLQRFDGHKVLRLKLNENSNGHLTAYRAMRDVAFPYLDFWADTGKIPHTLGHFYILTQT